MQNECFDLAVIGGGSGGYAAARTAASEGKKVVVIDGAKDLGGLCILRGCMPSKALIETANRNADIKEAGIFGIEVPQGKVHLHHLIDRKRELIADFQDYRVDQLQDGRFTLLRGKAKFLDPETLEVSMNEGGEKRQVKARTTVIATGSSIFVPQVPGLEEVGFWTSDDILDTVEVPESIIVLGGGAIALEMAHYLNGIGRKVTVIQRSDHLLSDMDQDVAKELENAMRAQGIEILCDTKLLKFEQNNGKKVVFFEHKGESKKREAAQILCALGRYPNVDGLSLEAAGVELKDGRINTSDSQQTSTANIFAAGDVCGPHEIVHIAIEQGEIAARNALRLIAGNDDFEEIDYRLLLYGIFTEPQVATVGMSEWEAEKAGRKVITASSPFNDHGKSMIHGSEYGFVKLIADAETREILGGAVIGPQGVELIHEITVAMAFRATAEQLAKIPHYHPTLSEIWLYPAEDLAEEEL